MPTFRTTVVTRVSAQRVISALTDFGPDRSKIWGLSSAKYLKVHSTAATRADVTEGSSGVWERLHYDWGTPGVVTMTTTASNAWGGDSGHTYTFAVRPGGGTELRAVVVRDPKNLRGRVISLLLSTRTVRKGLEKSLRAIEAATPDAQIAH